MANGLRGEAKVELGGSEFVLRFDMNAIAELEQQLGGDSITHIMSDAGKLVGVRFIRAAVYAGLLHDPKLARGMTIEKIGRLMQPEHLADLAGAVSSALASAFGADVEDPEGNAGGAEASADAPSP